MRRSCEKWVHFPQTAPKEKEGQWTRRGHKGLGKPVKNPYEGGTLTIGGEHCRFFYAERGGGETAPKDKKMDVDAGELVGKNFRRKTNPGMTEGAKNLLCDIGSDR